MDPFSINVAGVADLIASDTNKVNEGAGLSPEGAESEKYDALDLQMSDEALLKLRDEWEAKYAPYEGKIKPTFEVNKNSYLGKRPQGQWLVDSDLPTATNLQFESEETFLASALSKNPEPVVYCDNTPEGNAIASAVKTMLQFHADELVLRRKLTLMVRQWSIYKLGVVKHGWNSKINDIALDNRKIQDFIFDPEGYVDAYGDFVGYLGERIPISADKLVEMFPQAKAYIEQQAESRLGTKLTITEWWTDEFCFTTLKDKVLDKHKNEFFKYPEPEVDMLGQPVLDPMGQPQMSTPHNHFGAPKKPYTFLAVFSLQEQPHDITSLIEQNIPNQNRIFSTSDQIDYNISASNNGYAYSEDNFNQETAKQAANARRKGNPILIPAGGPIDRAILPLPAQDLPAAIFNQLEITKNDLRTSWGVQGLTAEPHDEDQTARGMILNQSHDTTRIGGGVGDAIEQVARNIFNWQVQLYSVFYDEKHFAAVMGNAKAVEYVTLSNQDLDRQLIVSVSPDSMKPKDEITNINLAQALYDKGAIGPKTLLKMVDFPNPDESAEDGALWQVDKMAYIQLNFPEMFAKLQGVQAEMAAQQMAQQAQGAAMTAQAEAGVPPEAMTEPEQNIAVDPASAALSQVALPA